MRAPKQRGFGLQLGDALLERSNVSRQRARSPDSRAPMFVGERDLPDDEDEDLVPAAHDSQRVDLVD